MHENFRIFSWALLRMDGGFMRRKFQRVHIFIGSRKILRDPFKMTSERSHVGRTQGMNAIYDLGEVACW